MAREMTEKVIKMPRGFGSFRQLPSGKIRLEKIHTFPDRIVKQRVSVTGNTSDECLRKMEDMVLGGFFGDYSLYVRATGF